MPKRHYVPDFILRNFAGADKVLWIMNKRTGETWCKKPSDRCRQAGYDAFAQKNYNPNDVEEALTELESEAAPIVEQIVECARRGRTAAFDKAEKDRLCAFLLVQILRIPRMKDYAMNGNWEFPEVSQVFWQMLKNVSTHDMPAGLEADVANADVKAHEHLDYIMWKRMTAMIIDVTRISPVVDGGFLICDEPCLLKGWLLQSGDRVVMPLARDVCLQLSRPEDAAGELEICGPGFVNELNLQTLEKSQQFIAGPNRACLERLMAG